MKQFLILFFALSITCAISQINTDSIQTEVGNGVAKFRVKADIGISRKFGDWTSVEFSAYNYLLKDLKYSGAKTLGIDYLLKDKVKNRVYVGLLFSNVGGKKTLPNQNFSDSLGNTFVSNYSYSTSFSTLAVQLSGSRYLGEGETLALWSAIQVGNTWFVNEEFAVNEKISKGSTKGFGVMLGIDIKLSEHLFLGGEARAWYSKIGNLDIIRINSETKESIEETLALEDLDQINLSRIDFTIGARYYF